MWEKIKANLTTISLEKIAPALIALAIGVLAVKILCRLLKKALYKSKMEPSAHVFFLSTFRVVLYVIVALVVAGTLGFNVSSLVALLSVVSLAISLAVQGTLSNIAGGLQVLSAHPFHVGDYVELGDASGTVEEIRMVYTVINTPDNKRIFVPNSDVAQARIVNYTAMGKRRVDMTFSVSYEHDAEHVKAALLRCADIDMVLKDPPVFVGLQAYQDSCVDYALLAWCETEHYKLLPTVLRERAQWIFKEEGIEIPYPHLDVRVDYANCPGGASYSLQYEKGTRQE